MSFVIIALRRAPMLISYRRTGGLLALLTLAAVVVATTVVTIAVVVTVLILAVVIAAVSRARAVALCWLRPNGPTRPETPWPHETIDAVISPATPSATRPRLGIDRKSV